MAAIPMSILEPCAESCSPCTCHHISGLHKYQHVPTLGIENTPAPPSPEEISLSQGPQTAFSKMRIKELQIQRILAASPDPLAQATELLSQHTHTVANPLLLAAFCHSLDACLRNRSPAACPPAPDSLHRCLHCLKTFPSEEILQHSLTNPDCFLSVTVSSQALLYCSSCSDFVHHPVFDTHRFRIDLAHTLPHLMFPASQPSPLLKSLATTSYKRHLLLSNSNADYRFPFTPTESTAARALCQALGHTPRRTLPAPVGLYNIGNTCYMNSILQPLLHSLPLQQFFLSSYHDHATCSQLRASRDQCESPHCMACEMDKLFLSTLSSSTGVNLLPLNALPHPLGFPLVPSSFLHATWSTSSMSHLHSYRMHDAHEFYSALLNELQTSLQTFFRHLHELGAPEPTKDPITAHFQGQMHSQLTCQCCGTSRSQPEAYFCLSLPLHLEGGRISPLVGARVSPVSSDGGGSDGLGVDVGVGTFGETPKSPARKEAVALALSPTARSPKLSVPLATTSLDECLEKFTAIEGLEERLGCDVCKEPKSFSKQMLLTEVPNVLCLHLKRFDNGVKLKNSVQFGSELDLEGSKYKLFGTVHHTGSLQTGHYTSCVRNNGVWYSCGDHFVREIDEGSVLAEQQSVYMLFFERVVG